MRYGLHDILPNSYIERALKLHYIEYYTENGHIYGSDTTEYTDLTGYTLKKLRDWLGY